MIRRFCDLCGKELTAADVAEPVFEFGVARVRLAASLRGDPYGVGEIHVACMITVITKGKQV